MKLYLVRHGESEANLDYSILMKKEDCNVELSIKGYQDAVNAGLKLRELLPKPFREDYLISSPWRRAKQTAAIVSGVLGDIPVQTHNGIHEHYMNLVDNHSNWKLFKQYESTRWNVAQFFDVKYEGGESLREVRERAQNFIDECKSSKQDILVAVCHGQFIKQVVSIVNEVDPDDLVHPANGEVVELEIP